MRDFVIASAVIVILVSGLVIAARAQANQSPEEILPGCSIPKHFGRLVSVLGGNNGGLAGQAVFEAEDGTIRWVPMMFNNELPIAPKASRKPLPANFPIIPRFECMTGPVWSRH